MFLGTEIDFFVTSVILIISVMKKVILFMSVAVMMAVMTGCKSSSAEQISNVNQEFRQEREFMNQADRKSVV